MTTIRLSALVDSIVRSDNHDDEAPFSARTDRIRRLAKSSCVRADLSKQSKSYFQNGHRTVYALDGIGQKHYYFQSNQLVIWLAAPPSLAADALQQILEVYP